MQFLSYTIQHGDTLWKVAGERWNIIYNLPINALFREQFPDPYKIKSGSVIHIPCHNEIPKPQENSIAHFSVANAIGDSICMIPLFKFFYKLGYRIHLYCDNRIKPLFRISVVEKILDVCDIRQYYEKNDIIVIPQSFIGTVSDNEYVNSGCYVISRYYRAIPYLLDNIEDCATRLFFKLLGIDPQLHDDFTTDFSFIENETEHYDVVISEGSYDPSRRFAKQSLIAMYNWYKKKGCSVVVIPLYGKKYDVDCINFDFDNNEQFNYAINVVKNCKLFITPDSGLGHVRARFKKPMLVFFGRKNVEIYDSVVHIDEKCFFEKFFDEQKMRSKINDILFI